VAVLATPYSSAEAAIAACGDLRGKIVVDCTNPVAPDLSGLTIGHSDSAGEAVARWAKGAKVIKALNTRGSGNMLNPRYGNETLSMFFCGDDADAKKLVTGLIAELGFEPVDAGGLTQARYLEPLAMLWISMAYRYGNGPDFGFRVVRYREEEETFSSAFARSKTSCPGASVRQISPREERFIAFEVVVQSTLAVVSQANGSPPRRLKWHPPHRRGMQYTGERPCSPSDTRQRDYPITAALAASITPCPARGSPR
jgi:hypothetical protein